MARGTKKRAIVRALRVGVGVMVVYYASNSPISLTSLSSFTPKRSKTLSSIRRMSVVGTLADALSQRQRRQEQDSRVAQFRVTRSCSRLAPAAVL